MALTIVHRGQKSRIERDDTWAPGRFRAVITPSDQHYRDDALQWQPINETLTTDSGGFDKQCDTVRHRVRFGSGGQRRWHPRRAVATEYVGVTDLEYWTGSQWQPLTLPAAVWKAQGAEWDLPTVTARVTNTWRQVKTDFVLKSAAAPTGLRFALTLVGLTLGADWRLTSTTDGLVVGGLPPPFAEDATGLLLPVTATYSGGFLTWQVTTTGATFPVVVDPTFTDGPSGDVDTGRDTLLNSVSPTQNNGGLPYCTRYGTSGTTLLQFDCTGVPLGAVCTAATLTLVLEQTTGRQTGDFEWYPIRAGNASWTEGASSLAQAAAGEPCWNAREANGAGGVTALWAGGVSAGCSVPNVDYDAVNGNIGVTSTVETDAVGTSYPTVLLPAIVQRWFGAGAHNYGICCPGPLITTRLGASESTTAARRPTLTVDYVYLGVAVAEYQRRTVATF